MNELKFFEDYEVGARRETLGRTITEADIVFHAGHTGDYFPHHMDAEFAAGTRFGQRIAHGTLVFAVAIGMTAQRVNPAAFTYGYDRLRFPRPVHIGDTIRVAVIVKRAEGDPKRPQYGRVVEQCEARNQRDEIVMVCEHVLLVERGGEQRPQSGPLPMAGG